MKSRILLVAALALLIPILASAQDRKAGKDMTVDDVIELSRSDVGDDVILSQIEASGVVFKLTVDDILELKKAGVSDRVITYMINTGKNDDDNDSGGERDRYDRDYEEGDRYRSSVDSRYHGYGYDDPNWNIYLSWGYGGYYDPFYYAWWPHYTWYYYPVTCFRSYWPYYPHYHHYYYAGWDGDHDAFDRRYKDGRQISGRGGARQAPVYRGDSPRSRTSGRDYKGTYGGRGSSSGGSRSTSGSKGSSGDGRTIKSPSYGGRGGQTPPPPASSSGTQSPPPPTSSTSGRTMKKS
jgi:hypothetical protein